MALVYATLFRAPEDVIGRRGVSECIRGGIFC
jgi:hypothetical protein